MLGRLKKGLEKAGLERLVDNNWKKAGLGMAALGTAAGIAYSMLSNDASPDAFEMVDMVSQTKDVLTQVEIQFKHAYGVVTDSVLSFSDSLEIAGDSSAIESIEDTVASDSSGYLNEVPEVVKEPMEEIREVGPGDSMSEVLAEAVREAYEVTPDFTQREWIDALDRMAVENGKMAFSEYMELGSEAREAVPDELNPNYILPGDELTFSSGWEELSFLEPSDPQPVLESIESVEEVAQSAPSQDSVPEAESGFFSGAAHRYGLAGAFALGSAGVAAAAHKVKSLFGSEEKEKDYEGIVVFPKSRRSVRSEASPDSRNTLDEAKLLPPAREAQKSEPDSIDDLAEGVEGEDEGEPASVYEAMHHDGEVRRSYLEKFNDVPEHIWDMKVNKAAGMEILYNMAYDDEGYSRMSAKEAAEKLGVSTSTVYRWNQELRELVGDDDMTFSRTREDGLEEKVEEAEVRESDLEEDVRRNGQNKAGRNGDGNDPERKGYDIPVVGGHSGNGGMSHPPSEDGHRVSEGNKEVVRDQEYGLVYFREEGNSSEDKGSMIGRLVNRAAALF